MYGRGVAVLILKNGWRWLLCMEKAVGRFRYGSAGISGSTGRSGDAAGSAGTVGSIGTGVSDGVSGVTAGISAVPLPGWAAGPGGCPCCGPYSRWRLQNCWRSACRWRHRYCGRFSTWSRCKAWFSPAPCRGLGCRRLRRPPHNWWWTASRWSFSHRCCPSWCPRS